MDKDYYYKTLLVIITYLGLFTLFMLMVLSIQSCIAYLRDYTLTETINRYVLHHSLADKLFMATFIGVVSFNKILQKAGVTLSLKERLPGYVLFGVALLILIPVFLADFNLEAILKNR